MLDHIKRELKQHAQPEKSKLYASFFKTGPGEYGEGDKFLGITMPDQRIVAKKFVDADISVVQDLLASAYHEHRMTGLLILTYKFEKADDAIRKKIFDFYIAHKDRVNNWDLVDVTTPKIVGVYLCDKDRALLYEYARSNHLWTRRIAVLATFPLIKQNNMKDSLAIAKILLHDTHDLIHKAVGWMLREVGKVNEPSLLHFLDVHYKKMPRTMLRYSIERLSTKQKKHYMN